MCLHYYLSHLSPRIPDLYWLSCNSSPRIPDLHPFAY